MVRSLFFIAAAFALSAHAQTTAQTSRPALPGQQAASAPSAQTGQQTASVPSIVQNGTMGLAQLQLACQQLAAINALGTSVSGGPQPAISSTPSMAFSPPFVASPSSPAAPVVSPPAISPR